MVSLSSVRSTVRELLVEFCGQSGAQLLPSERPDLTCVSVTVSERVQLAKQARAAD